MSLEAFAARLRGVRLSKLDSFGKPLSQRKAAQLFNVDISTYRNWECARNLPDERSRDKMVEIWPEVFKS